MPQKIIFYKHSPEKPLSFKITLNKENKTGLFKETGYDQSNLERDVADDYSIQKNRLFRMKRKSYKSIFEAGTLLSQEYNKKSNSLLLNFGLTDYSVYSAIAFPFNKDEIKISEHLKNKMKISSVGGIVITKDNYVFMQIRPEELISNGTIDSTASGVCYVKKALRLSSGLLDAQEAVKLLDIKKNSLDFISSMKEKIDRELNGLKGYKLQPCAFFSSLGGENVINKKIGGVFTGCYSAMMSFKIIINKNKEDFLKTLGKTESKLISIHMKDIEKFILKHQTSFCADGLSALISILDQERFNKIVSIINKGNHFKILIN